MYERQKESTHDRIPGTCEWVLHHPFFVDWKCGNSSGLLWVSADPGCGKSVKSKALVEEQLVTTDSDTIVCYYFFKDISSEQRSSNEAIAAFLHQLLSSKPHLLIHATPAWGKNGSDLSSLPTEMWAILRRIILYPEAGKIVCVIDALDECEASGRKYTINQLRALYTDTPMSMKSRLRFLVTSRSYSEIELDFKILTTTFQKLNLNLSPKILTSLSTTRLNVSSFLKRQLSA